jgi:5-hydroxyisourate hydrolase-like protein (transthyretin family)
MTSDERSGLTRRAVLRGAAAAGAASLVRPTGALAALSATPAGVFSRWVGSVSGESAAIAAPRQFALVGIEWSGPRNARIELRTRRSGAEAWSAWAVASVLGHGPDRTHESGRATERAGLFGEPIWSGSADYVQLRSSHAVTGLRLHFVAARPAPPPAHAAQAMPMAQPILAAGPGQPQIIARSAWAQGHAPPSHVPVYGTVKLAFIHHSDGTNGYSAGEVPSILQSIFDYHVYVRGFWDIAYNFAVDAYGRIWEARAGGVDLPVVGAHAGGYNQESTGMVVLGTFNDVVPSPAAIGALERLLAWKLSLHGVPALGRVTVEVAPYDAFYTPFAPGAHVSLPRIAGHRDGDTTDCPGNAFYGRLPSIRPPVAGLAGKPARATISAPATPVNSGTSIAVSGRLTDLSSGAPLTGAPIELQQIAPESERTIATATTDAGGNWSVTLTPTANVLVRALHRPAPAAVSDVAAIEVAPALTLTLDSSAPLQVSGTVSPHRASVTVDLYRLSGGRRHLIRSKQVAAGAGTFQASFNARRTGRYVLVARTTAGARNVAGASPPVALTIP